MIYRERQNISSSGDPNQNRDRYLDNCFLLCLNRDDNTNVPEIHRLENNLIRELCQKNSLNQQRGQTLEDDDEEEEEEELISSKQRDYMYRRKDNQLDRDSRLRYQQDDDNYYNQDQYSRTRRYNHRNDYNIMQHSDDELSVYEIYVPTNTLNRLSDKRIDNNMVLIDYEDVSELQDLREPPPSYGYPTRNIPSQYNNYAPLNQYNEYDTSSGFPRERTGQPQFYQNNPPQQQQFAGYYGNENNRVPYSSQSGSFFPANVPFDHSNAINVRRHIYSPSQLPQGLTEGQLVMLLQKGSQYQQIKSGPPTQPFPPQTEPPISTASAVTVSHQSIPVPNSHVELFRNPEYTASSSQVKIAQGLPQVIDHQLNDDDKSSVVDEITKPMSTLNTTNLVKPSKDIELKENGEKKKEKSSDLKKEKKAEKDTGESSKKDGKKEKSNGKDSKKKKK